jgi:D-alanyl-D-alanine carboxypeptidase (penicillin-binding protein 5/6)
MPLREGQVLTLGQLLWGILLQSANNGCVAAAEHIAGSESAFVEMMNRRAAELGARRTHFQNSSGLHAPSHYTTAYDLAVIARYALTIPAFEAIVRTRQASLYVDGSEAEVRLRNTNSLLWTFAGGEGIKTGTTDEAGKCLVASATREGRRLISVVLRSADRYRDTEVLLEWGFRNYETVRLARARRPLATARVAGGLVGEVTLVAERDLWVVCPAGTSEDVELQVDLARPLQAPVRRGQVVGVAEGVMGDEAVQAVNLLAADDVPLWTPERGFLGLCLRLFRFLAAHGIG